MTSDPLDDLPGQRSPQPDFDRPAPIGPVAPFSTPAMRPGRPFGLGRLLRWWLVVGTLLLLAVVAFVCISGVAFDFHPLHVNISGDDFADGITIVGLTAGAKALLAAGVLVVVLTLLLVLPVVLLFVFLALTLVVVCALAVPLLGLSLVLAAVTSPIWVVGLLVWLVARRRSSRPAVASARMAA